MGNSLQTYLVILKREKSMTSSLKKVKYSSDQKMIIVSAMKNSCGQLFLIGFSDWKERKVHNQFTQAGKIFSYETDAFICNEELLWTTLCDLIW